MDREPHTSSLDRTPAVNVILPVSADVERQLRLLLQIKAGTEAYERRKKTDPVAAAREGWAEQVHAFIQKLDSPPPSITADTLRSIVEDGKVQGADIPLNMRQEIIAFCAEQGVPESNWPTFRRFAAAMGLAQPDARADTGIKLSPETRLFLAGLRYEYKDVKDEAPVNTEGRARATPAAALLKLQSRVPVVQAAGFHLVESMLNLWVHKPPNDEQDRKVHYGDVRTVLGVAEGSKHFEQLKDAEKIHVLAMHDLARHDMNRREGAAA